MKVPENPSMAPLKTKGKRKGKVNTTDEENVVNDLHNIHLRSDGEDEQQPPPRTSLKSKSKNKKMDKRKQKIKRHSVEDTAALNSDNFESEGEFSDRRLSEGEGQDDDKSSAGGSSGRVGSGASTSGGDDDDDNDSIPSVDESDSSEDEVEPRNTIGDVPKEFYRDEEHVGYDISGKKIKKKERKDLLEKFLVNADNKKAWRKILDEYNDEEVEMTKDEIDMIRRVLEGRTPHADVDPFEDYVDFFVHEDKIHPLSNAPEPKRRFIRSKWEAKKIIKLVRAIREGRIKLNVPKEEQPLKDLWADDTSFGKLRGSIPAPKVKLPGHEESYNPSPEFIPTQEEIDSYQLMYEEDRPKFIPRKYTSLRNVPAYDNALQERQGRCFDLYLCPRVRKKRLDIDPESLKKSDKPKRKDLKPYPSTCYIEYKGHNGAVVSISPEGSGQWIASGSSDGTVRVWEVATGRCIRVWEFDHAIKNVAWNPSPQLPILAVSVGADVYILDTGLGSEEEQKKMKDLLHIDKVDEADDSGNSAIVSWHSDDQHGGLRLKHFKSVSSVEWHRRGDYFSTVMPAGESRGVMIHQLSKKVSQKVPFKLHGLPVCTAFHPTRSVFFIATKKNIRVYDLLKSKLIKKLETNLREVSCIAIHPGGDNVIVGSREGKWCWFDMDLSSKPYRTLKGHSADVTNVAFHRSYPLFASCSEDGQAYVYHGMVYSDLNQDPLLVALTKFRGHLSANGKGVLDCKFHPRQPWLFTAGADSVIKLYCH